MEVAESISLLGHYKKTHQKGMIALLSVVCRVSERGEIEEQVAPKFSVLVLNILASLTKLSLSADCNFVTIPRRPVAIQLTSKR